MRERRYTERVEVPMSPAMRESVKALAEERGLDMSVLIRSAIVEYILRASVSAPTHFDTSK